MPKSAFEPCIPTKAAKVPNRPEWLHEIKHDGYRLIVQREDKRVRLFARNGHDWSGRFPVIVFEIFAHDVACLRQVGARRDAHWRIARI